MVRARLELSAPELQVLCFKVKKRVHIDLRIASVSC